jgi:hypothetical protein
MTGTVITVLSAIFLPSLTQAEEKTISKEETAVVKYDKYEYGAKRQNHTKNLVTCVVESGFEPALIDETIFLKENRGKCASYKRILVPAIAHMFSSEMYEGMTEYVQNGGLLIINTSPLFMGSYNDSFEKQPFGKLGFELVGVYGQSTGDITKMRILSLSPITEGLPANEWIALEPSAIGRLTKITGNATEVVTADVLQKGKPIGNRPLLTYKRTGKGVCIYFVPTINPVMDENLKALLKNVLSDKTLKWLTR